MASRCRHPSAIGKQALRAESARARFRSGTARCRRTRKCADASRRRASAHRCDHCRSGCNEVAHGARTLGGFCGSHRTSANCHTASNSPAGSSPRRGQRRLRKAIRTRLSPLGLGCVGIRCPSARPGVAKGNGKRPGRGITPSARQEDGEGLAGWPARSARALPLTDARGWPLSWPFREAQTGPTRRLPTRCRAAHAQSSPRPLQLRPHHAVPSASQLAAAPAATGPEAPLLRCC